MVPHLKREKTEENREETFSVPSKLVQRPMILVENYEETFCF